MPDRQAWVLSALRRYERPLVRYARRLTGDLESARDVVQECFLRLCRQRRNKVKAHLRPWLYSVCRNLAFDRLRKERRMEALDDSTAEPQASPVVRLERRERNESVAASGARSSSTSRRTARSGRRGSSANRASGSSTARRTPAPRSWRPP